MGNRDMASLIFSDQVFNREILFCKVYSMEGKEKLEQIFLKNRISYFIEWQEKSLIRRMFGSENSREKNVFTIRINEADTERARELVSGIETVKLKKNEAE